MSVVIKIQIVKYNLNFSETSHRYLFYDTRTALRLPIITQPRTTNLASLPVPTCPHDPRLLTDPRSPSQAPFIYELSAGGANLTDDSGKKP